MQLLQIPIWIIGLLIGAIAMGATIVGIKNRDWLVAGPAISSLVLLLLIMIGMLEMCR